MKPGPHELAQQHPTKQGVNNDLVMHQRNALPPRSGRQNNKTIGADFRYAVEFSKNGRTPLEVSRPPPGQPDLRYRLASTIPNRRRLPDPDSLAERKLRQLRPAELVYRGCPLGRPAAVDRGDPAAVRFPLGHGRSYGLIAPCVKPAGHP